MGTPAPGESLSLSGSRTRIEQISERLATDRTSAVTSVVLQRFRKEWQQRGWSQFCARFEPHIPKESWFARTREPARSIREHLKALETLCGEDVEFELSDIEGDACDILVRHASFERLTHEEIAALQGWIAAELSLSTVSTHRQRSIVGLREESGRLRFRVVPPSKSPLFLALLGNLGQALNSEFRNHHQLILETHDSADRLTIRAASSERRLAQVLETLDEGYLEESEGRLEISSRFRQMTDIEASTFDELRSKWLERTPIEDLEANEAAFDTMRRVNGRLFRLPLIIDGNRHTFEMFVRTDDGRLTGTLSDETARYKALKREATRRETLEALLELSPYAIAIHNDNELLFTNNAYDEEFGANLPDVTDRTVKQSVNSSMLTENETRVTQQDGSQKIYELATSMIEWLAEGAFITTFRDVTEERAFLAKSFELDRIVALGTLADGVAHEINNPLAYVQSNIEYAVREARKLDPAPDEANEVIEALEEAFEGSNRVSDLVREFRSVSPGEQSDALDFVDVEEVITSARNLASATVKPRATISTRIDVRKGIMGSAPRLAQVVINLLVNAAQAFPEDRRGQIEIVANDLGDSDIAIEVRDTGSGVPQELLDDIFKPFFTTKVAGEGTGLGLSICRNIIEGMGGTLTIASEVGKGTTARIVLPGVERPRETAPTLGNESSVHTYDDKRVLVIDDDPHIGRMIRRVLKNRADVQVETSAMDGLQRATREDFDIILSDVVMPQMNGREFILALLERRPDYQGRLVLMSGGNIKQPLGLTIPILTKPFGMKELRDLVTSSGEEAGS